MKNQSFCLFLAVVIVMIASLFAGCSYDNTMYNARKYFKAAQARALTQAGKPTPQAIDEYTKTIKKCGYILTEKKNSKDADDALFLLAQALYFKGNGQYQARDQFYSLVNNFPQSPYVPESIMFIAQINRQINENQEAENILTNFVREQDKAKWHPQAMSLLADFALQDKDLSEAEYWLDRLITQFPKTKQGKEAPLLLGKIYYEKQDYKEAIKQFNRILSTRGVQYTLKLDARYNIAVCYLMLDSIKQSHALTKKLLKDETRPERIPHNNLLLGRVLLAMDKVKETDELFTTIVKTNGKTPIAAEAYYWLAEYYYFQMNDILKALDHYNKAKTESNASAFNAIATQKHAALIARNQNAKVLPSPNPQLFVETRLAIAEDYYTVFNQEQTAFAVIDSISLAPLSLQIKIDSLSVKRETLLVSLDTLLVAKHNLLDNAIEITNVSDSIAVDSLQAEETSLKLDTVSAVSDTLVINANITKLQGEITALEVEIKRLNDINEAFNKEYLPFALFFKAAMIFKKDKTSTQLPAIYSSMNQQYHANKYTTALKLMLEDKPVRLVDVDFEKDEAELETALDLIAATPDSAVVMLSKLTQSAYPEISTKAIFRLGWHYTFERFDSTLATQYLSDIVKKDRTSDYAKLVMRFFNGSRFTFSREIKDSIAVVSDTLLDSLSIKSTDFTSEEEKELETHNEPDTKVLDNPEFQNPISPVIKPEEDIPFKP